MKSKKEMFSKSQKIKTKIHEKTNKTRLVTF